MSAEQTTETTTCGHTYTWDCGHTHLDGGTRACGTVIDFEFADCLNQHIRGCTVCSR